MVERNKCMSIPKIRFNGTKQNWEKAELSVYAKQYFVSNKNIHHHNLLSLSYGQIIRKDIKSKKGLLPSSYDTYQIVCKGIIVFRFTDLQNDRNSLRVGLVKEEGIITPAYICVQCKGVMPEFFYLQLYAYDLRKIFYKMGDGMRQTLSYKDIKNLFIYIPPTQEQKKIINHFDLLDKVIDLTSKKLASLKRIKAASLQSMFPQEGETVPKVRFKGFEGEWKKFPFGSFLKESYERSTVENEDILLSSAITGVYLNSELFGHQRGASNIGYKKIKKNMLILSAQNLHLGNANVNLRFEHGLISPAYKVYEIVNISPLFLQQWIKMDSTKSFFLNATTAGASLCRKNIVWDDLYKQIVLIPSKNEQVKIGLFFSNFDKQISLQTQRLEKLKQIKSACMDKMFV